MVNDNDGPRNPNMQVDQNEYVVPHPVPADDVASITPPDNLDAESDFQDMPEADNFEAMKEVIFPDIGDEYNVLAEAHHTWEITGWRRLAKKEHGPVFEAGGFPWRVLLFPYGNNVDQASIYLEHGFEPGQVPDDYSCCIYFALVMWNPNDPKIYTHHHAQHRYTKEEGDWGFTRYCEFRKMFQANWPGFNRPMVENDSVNITAYVRVIEDETGVLWSNLNNYNSKKETGYIGLKNQGATCYLNSLLQSLYCTNAFRKAVYQIPTQDEETMTNSAYTLQRLFYQLQTSNDTLDTKELTKSFGWDNNRDVFEQHDVQELLTKLLELLENKMKDSGGDKILDQLFNGKMKNYIKCINVDYESSRVEKFSDIQLTVAGMGSLEKGFEDYVRVERLEGDNQYMAGDEHKLQDADKGVKFIQFPDVLGLHLMRFQYDYERDITHKTNDRYEYPEELDVSPYLDSDADFSESWEYQLHSVFVHQGELNAGHYYAFIRPKKDGWFYKFDDDKVTKARMKEVMEENFGGEIRTANRGPLRNPNGKKIMRSTSAYYLVYIRKSRIDQVLAPVTEEDIPSRLVQRFKEEAAEKERREKERSEQHLYLTVKAASLANFKNYGGVDISPFDADPNHDEAAPHHYRLLRSMTFGQLAETLGPDMGVDPNHIRFWIMVNRQNKTTRPDQPIMDPTIMLEEILRRSATARDPSLRVWVEVAEEVDENGVAIWPSFQPGQKTDNILLYLKHFDVESQSLRGVGHIYINKEKKVEDLVPLIRAKMGWPEKQDGEKLQLWEEIKPQMIEVLKAKQTLKAAELQDGDIITFQRQMERKSNAIERRLGLGDKSSAADKATEDQDPKFTDHYENARDYYHYLFYKRGIAFIPHPTKNLRKDLPSFDLDLNLRMSYDHLSHKIGDKLGVPGTHLKFYTVNATTGSPKMAVKRTGPQSASLVQILYPNGTFGQVAMNQRSDALFYEVLEISLAELETKKPVLVTWLSEGISKEEKYDLLVNRTGMVEDLVGELLKKAKLEPEDEAGKIRVYEVSNSKFYKELPRNFPVVSLNDYTTIVAERVPEEEIGASETSMVSVFSFHTHPSRPHGMPFRFLMIEGEKFSETKKRLEKRTGLKGKSFEKIRFAVVVRAHHSQAKYLEDDDVLQELILNEDYFLGMDHPDRTRSTRLGPVDLTLK